MIRIIGGSAKGRNLIGPRGSEFRPATGIVKGFIFNYLGDWIQGIGVLDLFSGSGSLGLEALSRGAERVTFVESSWDHVQILLKNISMCRFEDKARVLRGDVFKEIGKMALSEERFPLILADPPFKQCYRESIAQAVERNRILDAGGLLIIEHAIKDMDTGRHGLELARQRQFGQSMMSIYEWGKK